MPRRLTYDEFLRWLQRRIDAAGVTQQAFAEDLKVSPGYLSDVLNRKRTPSRRLLNAVLAREVRLFEVDAM